MNNLINLTKELVKERLPTDITGHDWHHAFRVCKTAKYIARKEGGNLIIVTLGALLHDIGDWKFNVNDDNGISIAKAFLASNRLDEKTVNSVCHIIEHISYKGANTTNKMTSLEGQIVQDADRLDALGAIGIARAFAYGGFKGRPLHDPMVPPAQHRSFEEYKSSTGTTYNHFYEKLLLIKDRMNTTTGRELAIARHEFLENFLVRFKYEWACVP